MNIIFDNIIYSIQKAGGISVYWSELISHFLRSKHTLNFLEYPNNNIFRKNIEIKDNLLLKVRNTNFFYQRYFNPRVVNQNKKTIFHSSYYRTMKGKNHFNIVTVHDFTYEIKLKSISKYLHITQKRNALNRADGIICISNSTKNDLLRIYPKLNRKRIKVIYNAYDDKSFFYKSETIKKLDEVLFVGGRAGYKNFRLAVDSISLSINLFLNIVNL